MVTKNNRKKSKNDKMWDEAINVWVFNKITKVKRIQRFKKRKLLDKIFIFHDLTSGIQQKGKCVGMNEENGDLIFVTENENCKPDSSKPFMMIE